MTSPHPHITFNPNIFLGIGASFVPLWMIQRGVDQLIKQLHIKYPRLQEQWTAIENKTVAFFISDMPFHLHITITRPYLQCQVLPKQAPRHTDVTIYGTSQTLVALLEGTEDGDALFFSREIDVAGDTEVLLILRNTFDNARIHVRALLFSLFGPFSGPFQVLSKPLEMIIKKFIQDSSWLYQEMLSPFFKQQAHLNQRLLNLEERLEKVETKLAKRSME